MYVTINPEPFGELTDEQLYKFCIANKELRIERNTKSQLIIKSPTGLDTSFYNSHLLTEVSLWNRQHKLGKVSDSNGGYTLPNGAMYAPDVAWISHERWATVPKLQRSKFAHICPNFVIELMSESDTLKQSQAKMIEWIENGVQLGWLIYPQDRKVYIYTENGQMLTQDFDQKLMGGNVLPGFELDLQEIFGE